MVITWPLVGTGVISLPAPPRMTSGPLVMPGTGLVLGGLKLITTKLLPAPPAPIEVVHPPGRAPPAVMVGVAPKRAPPASVTRSAKPVVRPMMLSEGSMLTVIDGVTPICVLLLATSK